MDEVKEVLTNGAKELSVELDESMTEKFMVFSDELCEWNKVMNLTAIKEPKEIAIKHFVDSLALLKYADIKPGAKIADVGCGAGFPGHPLKIVRPDITLCSIDSLGKRLNFLDDLEKKLEMTGCTRVHLRAEEAGAKPEYREKFDYSTARAVASLRVLAEYCLPLVKVGGYFIAMKGNEAEQEIDEAKPAIKTLCGQIEKVIEYNLPMTDNKRTIILIKKIAPTDKRYPRSNAKIAKNPL